MIDENNTEVFYMYELKKLKEDAVGITVLYVEDNRALSKNVSNLLHKFFENIFIAFDGEEGFELFKKEKPDIVITDIKMPKMDGLELAKEIKESSLNAKVIVMSAFDDREYLFSAIEIGIFRFLKKPVNISEFAEVLHSALLEIKEEKNENLFTAHLQNVFNYQSSIVIMVEEGIPTFVNQMFLDFFHVKDIEMFLHKFKKLGNIFLQHNSFLSSENWYKEVKNNSQKLYNVKIQDIENNAKHFILKYQEIPDKKSCGILSFDDVTELNLMKLYDASQVKDDKNLKDTTSLFNLLKVIKRNNAKVELHNFYKGISITHDAIIGEIKESSIVVKTDYMQEKAIQFDQRSFITSDALPNVVACDSVEKISFKYQSVEFKNIHFTKSSPVSRKTLRVVPEQEHSVSLFMGENKYRGDIYIEDVSLEAVRLNLESMPASLNINDRVRVDMVLSIENRPMTINTQAVMFSKKEHKRSFSIVLMLKFEASEKKNLVEYMTSRQMSIIREFKGMQNG